MMRRTLFYVRPVRAIQAEPLEDTMSSRSRYAGLWPRFMALGVDLVVFCAVFFPLTRLVKGVWLMAPADHRWVSGWFITDPLCLSFLLVMFLYFVLLEGWLGATVGKATLGLRVVSADGRVPGLKASVLRNLLRTVDSLPTLNILGAVLILRSEEHARFGDRIAGTRVVRSR
jgi:uncharacterized RDD family membrane protein YckC